jgi:hypothetical protein
LGLYLYLKKGKLKMGKCKKYNKEIALEYLSYTDEDWLNLFDDDIDMAMSQKEENMGKGGSR